MAAITWRSLMGQTADPVRAMTAAQDSFNGMFDTFNKTLETRNNSMEEASKQGFLNELYGAQSVEGFDQSRESLAGKLQGLSAENQAAVRPLLEQRRAQLMQSTLAGQQYADAQQTRGQQDVVSGLQEALMRASTPEEAKRLEQAIGIYQSNGMLNNQGGAALMKDALGRGTEMDNQAWTNKERGQKELDWDHLSKTLPLELESKRLGLDTSKINKDLNQLNLENVQDQRTVDGALSKAYLAAQGTMMQNGLPNESAMTAAATVATEGMDPRIAAKVLQQARQVDVANVQAWRDDQDKNGYVGSVPLNPTAVSSSLEEVIKTIPEGDQESVRTHVTELVRNGVTLPKGTQLPDGTTLNEDLKVPVPFNVARSAILESYGPWYKLGYRRGASATDIIEEQVKRPEVFMDILTRDRAERLKESLRKDPDLSSGTLSTKKKN